AWVELLRTAGLSRDPAARQVAAALVQATHSSPLAASDWLSARRGQLEHGENVTADPVKLALRAMDELDPLDGEEEVLTQMEDAIFKWQRATRAVDVTGRALARSPRFVSFLKFLQETFQDEPDSHVLVFTSFESNVHPLYLLVKKALQGTAEVLE